MCFTALLYTSCSSGSKNSNNVSETSAIMQQPVHEITHGVKQISNSQVCMVNDKFMNKDTCTKQNILWLL